MLQFRLVEMSGSETDRKVQSGFTLIEVMIVVAVIAILAAIAFPSYQEAVRKGKRAQGRTALLEFMQAQERSFTQTNTYRLIQPEGVGDSTTTMFKLYSGDGSGSSAYLLRAVVCPGGLTEKECVQLEAVPQFPDSAVGKLIMLSSGAKTCDVTANIKTCWP